MGVKLMDALRTFRVEGELVGRTTGPVVTQYEVAPAAGVKVRQIANLSNDLALAMRAQSIRIVAPIPGKGAVGVEVPNPTAEIVAFRELIESREFQNIRAALPIALGKDLEGRPIIADLAKMPHLLIAGATGSGKSICINTLITSLGYRHTPTTLRFLMVDPMMVELSVYNVLPHLRHKVVTDNRDAAAVLKWAVLEMQDRYELLAANGARNIQDFNRKVQEGQKLKNVKRSDVAFEDLEYKGGIVPYIVVVIDELADLMMTVQGEIETPLAMLAQKARAIGIHLILATQRPSVNVITGLIKANFPSRIAFRVASQVDSRTILDGIGAEALLGNGDMLFIPPGKSEPARLQGAFISSEDTERLMGWYELRREQRKAAFDAQGLFADGPSEADIIETIRRREAEEAAGGDAESFDDTDRDKLFREAAEVVIQHQQGSTSLLQRRLKVGYGRAARIIDQLHAAGILGPPVAPVSICGMTGTPGHIRRVTFSTGPIISGVSGDGLAGTAVLSLIGVTRTESSATTRTSVALISPGASPGIMRQLTMARARWGSALGAWPPSSIVGTQVVRSCALYIGDIERRAALTESRGSLAMVRMSDAICPVWMLAKRSKKTRVVSVSRTGKWKR